MSVFINLSNHPSKLWEPSQYSEAEKFGTIRDIPFPSIATDITDEEMNALVEEYFQKVRQYEKPVVMLQGEFVFVYRLVNRLKAEGIRVVCACTNRVAEERILENGSVEKISNFVFYGFREY